MGGLVASRIEKDSRQREGSISKYIVDFTRNLGQTKRLKEMETERREQEKRRKEKKREEKRREEK